MSYKDNGMFGQHVIMPSIYLI